MIFGKVSYLRKEIPDFLETIPAYLNFAEFLMFFSYPEQLSYSSSNAYIRKIRVWEPGKASCLLKHLKKRLKTNEFFVCDEYAVFRTINSVAAGYRPLTHVYPLIAVPAPGCGGTSLTGWCPRVESAP